MYPEQPFIKAHTAFGTETIEDWNLEGLDQLSAIFLESTPSGDMSVIDKNKISTKTWEVTTQVKQNPSN